MNNVDMRTKVSWSGMFNPLGNIESEQNILRYIERKTTSNDYNQYVSVQMYDMNKIKMNKG